MNSKIELGQFYTKKSPFEFERFQVWFRALPNFPNLNIIEPFGGSNAIIKMILDEFEELTFKNWSSFDIQPEAQQNNLVPMIKLMQQDTLKEFPDGFEHLIISASSAKYLLRTITKVPQSFRKISIIHYAFKAVNPKLIVWIQKTFPDMEVNVIDERDSICFV